MKKIILLFTEPAVNQKGFTDCCSFMTGISSHSSQLTHIYLLQSEKLSEVVFLYVFKMAFQASLFLWICECRSRGHNWSAVVKSSVRVKGYNPQTLERLSVLLCERWTSWPTSESLEPVDRTEPAPADQQNSCVSTNRRTLRFSTILGQFQNSNPKYSGK